MRLPKSWLRQILAAILCVGVAQAAPPNAAEPQRSFVTVEEAAGAFVAALRSNQEADLRAILGPGADRVLHPGDQYEFGTAAHYQLRGVPRTPLSWKSARAPSCGRPDCSKHTACAASLS